MNKSRMGAVNQIVMSTDNQYPVAESQPKKFPKYVGAEGVFAYKTSKGPPHVPVVQQPNQEYSLDTIEKKTSTHDLKGKEQ